MKSLATLPTLSHADSATSDHSKSASPQITVSVNTAINAAELANDIAVALKYRPRVGAAG